ncbi:MAG: glutamate racemase [Prevotellaceae bacterium]|jgi:glutamate racemase|nr:glutamate racemase [Prevotellaceae bacterium]
MQNKGAIGVFDSGYGGLTILEAFRQHLPQYDYIYLGDNARTPYGTRSSEVVYEYTLQAVKKLFEMSCPLVILACNTSSAKALSYIQHQDLPRIAPDNRVLGVIHPTVEVLGETSKTRHIGILGTAGTVQSGSYPIEIDKLYNDFKVESEACPLWVPIVESGEMDSEGADYFVKKNVLNIMAKDPEIDTLILACTHYPLLIDNIRKFVPEGVNIIAQGNIVAKSLEDYLAHHPKMDERCTKNGTCQFYTTEQEDKFKKSAQLFLHQDVDVKRITL